jgi:hypothetical protein
VAGSKWSRCASGAPCYLGAAALRVEGDTHCCTLVGQALFNWGIKDIRCYLYTDVASCQGLQLLFVGLLGRLQVLYAEQRS